MVGQGRESQKDNDLFFTCSLIEYISRKTKNTRADVVNKLGKVRIDKIYDLADIYHAIISIKLAMNLLKRQILFRESLIM